MGLLDMILGGSNSGESAGSMIASAPASGTFPPGQVAMPPGDPFGNPGGGPASEVPLPRARPAEAGPRAADLGLTSVDAAQPSVAPAPRGGLAAALGLDPDRMKVIAASLAGGLANVRNSPFIGEALANAGGHAIQAGGRQEDIYDRRLKDLDRALRLLGADNASSPWARQGVARRRDRLRAVNASAPPQ